MSSQINPSSINPNFPVAGVNQPSQGFRTNFLAIQNAFTETVNEINDLISKVIVSAPLTYGSNANINNFSGMPISNVQIVDFGYTTSNHGTVSASSSINFDFTQGYYHAIDIEGSGSTITVNPTNFPNLGYSEMIIGAKTNNAPQYLNFTNLATSGNISVGRGLAGYNSVSHIFTLTGNSVPYSLSLSSADGTNWILGAIDRGAVARSYTPATSNGAPGDTAGMLAYDASYLYICTANYNGSTAIWKRISSVSF